MAAAALRLGDVRRLTGPNFLIEGIGAAGEASAPDNLLGPAVALWRVEARALLDGIGWREARIAVRPYPGGASLAVTAPLDGLYGATDLIEAAWAAVEARLGGTAPPDRAAQLAVLQEALAEEAVPGLVPLVEEARRRGLSTIHAEGELLIGLGKGGRSWPERDLPAPGDVPWAELSDIPVAMVTGTNGKSTCVRLAAAVGAAAGYCVGLSSSDWVKVGGEIIDEGDYSGPAGARLALGDPRVDLAVLESARGGLLRRGLVVERADAALITNVSLDHVGQYGITGLESLVAAKFTLAKAVKPGGRLVLNADDPALQRASAGFGNAITWFTLESRAPWLDPWLAAGGEAAYLDGADLVLAKAGERQAILSVSEAPITLGGAARFNIANALGVIGLADALGLPIAAMAAGLAGFRPSVEDNPGRGNFIELGDVTILLDFAHNPHGTAALIEAIKGLSAARRLYLLGQAGDRRDEDIRALTDIVWETRPERIIVKEMEGALRGRQPGEVPAIIARRLEELGASGDVMSRADSEMAAVRQALEWARAGDLLVLLIHKERKEALKLFDELKSRGWSAGDKL